jgi:hypothetical protein
MPGERKRIGHVEIYLRFYFVDSVFLASAQGGCGDDF